MTNVSLVRIGGVSAILIFVIYVVSSVFAGLGQVFSDDVAEVLTAMNDNRATHLASVWLVLPGSILLIPAALGLFQALREAGALLWIATAAMITGALLFIAAAIVLLGVIYQLAPGYVEAGDATKPVLMVIASTLFRFQSVATDAAIVLVSGIGVLIFALVIIRTSIVRSWVGWLAFPTVIFAWLSTLEPMLGTMEGLGARGVVDDFAYIVFMLWILVVGVVLVRLKKPVVASD